MKTYKKFLGLFLAIVMLFSLCTSVSAVNAPNHNTTQSQLIGSNEDGISQERDYLIYDIQLGSTEYHSFNDLPKNEDEPFSPGYSPNGNDLNMTNNIAPLAIIGEDNRVRIQTTTIGPYCNTVYLRSTFNGATMTASGFVIGPSIVLTAAHCVYQPEYGGLATSVTVAPAKNGDSEPYGRTTGTSIICSPDYVSGKGVNYDWAIVVLKEPLGNQTGWLGLQRQPTLSSTMYVYNTGYPSKNQLPAQNENQSFMFLGMGTIQSAIANRYIGNWDASGGNSGGPVFAYYSETGYTALGILTSGSAVETDGSSYPTAYSVATRITPELYDLILQYR